MLISTNEVSSRGILVTQRWRHSMNNQSVPKVFILLEEVRQDYLSTSQLSRMKAQIRRHAISIFSTSFERWEIRFQVSYSQFSKDYQAKVLVSNKACTSLPSPSLSSISQIGCFRCQFLSFWMMKKCNRPTDRNKTETQYEQQRQAQWYSLNISAFSRLTACFRNKRSSKNSLEACWRRRGLVEDPGRRLVKKAPQNGLTWLCIWRHSHNRPQPEVLKQEHDMT